MVAFLCIWWKLLRLVGVKLRNSGASEFTRTSETPAVTCHWFRHGSATAVMPLSPVSKQKNNHPKGWFTDFGGNYCDS